MRWSFAQLYIGAQSGTIDGYDEGGARCTFSVTTKVLFDNGYRQRLIPFRLFSFTRRHLAFLGLGFHGGLEFFELLEFSFGNLTPALQVLD